jgi:hypothetical protein
MRTTLVLDDPIFEKAKKRSFEMGITLSKLTTTALREYLYSKPGLPEQKSAFIMPVIGDPSPSLHQTPQELAQLRDEGR